MDLEPLREALAAQPAVQLAVVFGSAAKGRNLPGSDLDLAVRLAPDSAGARRGAAVAAGRATGREVDLVALDGAPPLLRFQIARDGRVLVEREPGSWTRFKARAMIDWWDWAPTARMMHAIYLRRLREKVAHGGA
jgi:predicted nucleotidyltransferase